MSALRSLFILSLLCSLLVFSLTALSAGAVAADSEYDLEVSDAVDTPERTVSLEGNDYQVDSIVARDAGDSIEVDVMVPEGGSFENVYLYNSDRQIAQTGSGSDPVTLDTSGLDPGTYVIALYADSNYQTILPVVINGYDISTTYPSDVAPGEDVTISAEVTKTDASADPPAVETIIWTDSTTRSETLAHQSGGTYETTLSFDEEDEYQVYTAVQGDESVAGIPVSLGLDDGGSITVESSSEQNGDSDDGSTSTGGGVPPSGSDDTQDPDGSETNETNSTNSVDNGTDDVNQTNSTDDGDNETVNPADNTTNTSDDQSVDDGSNTNRSDDGESTSDDSTDDSSVIQPGDDNDSTTDDESTTPPPEDQPGFGVILASIALLLLALIHAIPTDRNPE